MVFLQPAENAFLHTLSRLAYCNPFLAERIDYERRLLGEAFVEESIPWNLRGDDLNTPLDNPLQITARVEVLLRSLRERLAQGARASAEELQHYEDAVFWLLYYRYEGHFYALLEPRSSRQPCRFYEAFERDWRWYFSPAPSIQPAETAHIFACFFQIRRAFQQIFRYLIGGSNAAARLRATVWQSIFTHDMRRYRRTLYACMGDFTTLITGPSGTGKELVARAIGLSRYIPFQPGSLTFAEDFQQAFYALNLSALPSTLIESELFGHKRGAFTGAQQDRKGWLEVCSPRGAVFLDEIGDLDPALQVKLLRVLQTRTFHALGDTAERRFAGKLLAATNRDLARAIRQGQMREDFYYRLCADRIVTPSLYEQLQESPQVLHTLLTFLAQRIAPAEAEALAAEVETWILQHLGRDYPWPGNIRELEQCVRNVLIRQEYQPLPEMTLDDPYEALAQDMARSTVSAEALLSRYCTLVYAQTGSYEETARRLDLDRRTVRRKIEEGSHANPG